MMIWVTCRYIDKSTAQRLHCMGLEKIPKFCFCIKRVDLILSSLFYEKKHATVSMDSYYNFVLWGSLLNRAFMWQILTPDLNAKGNDSRNRGWICIGSNKSQVVHCDVTHINIQSEKFTACKGYFLKDFSQFVSFFQNCFTAEKDLSRHEPLI